MLINLYHADGSFIKQQEFSSAPHVDDVLLVDDKLMAVVERRWQDGKLDVILDYYE